jgi:hypothetical protein
MTNLSLRLPDSLHAKVRELAERDDVSINQFIATAIAEKAAALMTVEYLEERAREADPKLFDQILSRVPDTAPIAGDELRPLDRSKRRVPRAGVRRKATARRRPGSRRG